MNFYDLSRELNVKIEDLYEIYRILFQNVRVYNYTVNLTKREIEQIKNYCLKTNFQRRI
jgi:hypothetical protein